LKALEEEDDISEIESNNSTDEKISLMLQKFKQMLKRKGQENKRFLSKKK